MIPARKLVRLSSLTGEGIRLEGLTYGRLEFRGQDMRLPSHTSLSLALMVGAYLIAGAGPASAQDDLNGRSLGGYGAISVEAMPRTGDSPLIPYAGGFAGFMPYRMGGGGALAFETRRTSAMALVRSSFSLSSASGGMGSGSRLFLGSGPRIGRGSLTSGMQTSLAMRQGTTRPISMGVMPPRIGYPFRQPPRPGAATSGMFMPMP
jgi:hypothetical protein